MHTGHCHCEAIRFEIDGEPSDVSFCHCSLCRKLSGSAFTAYFEVSQAALRIEDSDGTLEQYAVTAKLTNAFCRRCGTPLFTSHADYPDFVYPCITALDDDTGIVPEYHQFVGSKAPWHRIADDLPQYQSWPD